MVLWREIFCAAFRRNHFFDLCRENSAQISSRLLRRNVKLQIPQCRSLSLPHRWVIFIKTSLFVVFLVGDNWVCLHVAMHWLTDVNQIYKRSLLKGWRSVLADSVVKIILAYSSIYFRYRSWNFISFTVWKCPKVSAFQRSCLSVTLPSYCLKESYLKLALL